MSSADGVAIDIPGDHMANAMIDSQLHECVRQNINTEEFRRLVEQRSAEKLVTPCGNTLLHVAVGYGSDNITSYLAETFPSLITIQNSQKDTILHLAAREGQATHAIRSLVELNPITKKLIMKKNTKGNTPLHDAVIADNKEVAQLLVSRDPEVAYYNNNNGKSPLYLAVENGNKNGILDDLLNLGVSFPIKSEDGDALPEGKSPVHAAIKQRNTDILEKIGKEKPELLRLTEEELGNSLDYASSIGFLEGVRFLLTKFPDGAFETNLEGNYPIHLACKSRSADAVKEFLAKFPYPKEFLNKKGQNILHVAAKYGNSRVVSYILEQDQKLVKPLLNAIDEDGNTPLHLAAVYGRCMATSLLVRDNRVEHFIVNNENFTPYDVAKQQSKMAVDQYNKTDEMLAKEREQFDSKNSIPADEIKIEVNSEDVKDGKKNSTTEKATASTGSQRKDKAVDSKDYRLLDYYGTMTTLSILYFHARPKKPLYERFTSTQGKPPRKQETHIRIQNLLVVAVLVAGVTFAALFLLLPSVKYPKFQISAVGFSNIMVCLAIFMMFGAFLFSVKIALIGGCHGWLFTFFITGVAVLLVAA
ncbi:hypothetical protein NC652_031834 [Populus alba x Populus x berolinensis]|nr:hypothetical protein NC652_031834 [Populus alba x Populus x berolinensis]